MSRLKGALIAAILTSMGIPSVSSADSANPPMINSVTPSVSPPFLVGSIVTFDINYSGGSPGLRDFYVKSHADETGAGANGCFWGWGIQEPRKPQFTQLTSSLARVSGVFQE